MKSKNKVIQDQSWSTHLVPLIMAVLHTNGAMLEMGCGNFSTPVLDAICKKQKRFLLSADTSQDWINKFIDLENVYHKFLYIPAFDDPNNVNLNAWNNVPDNIEWSVILVDHAPMRRRGVDILRFKDIAQILVVHDAKKCVNQEILSQFKYIYTYDKFDNQTVLLSNKIDVQKIF